MQNKKMIMAGFALALLASVALSATDTYTGTSFTITTTYPDSVNEGDTLSITVSIQNTGSQSQTVTGSISSADGTTWFTGTSSQSFGTLSSGASNTKSFTLTASSGGGHMFTVTSSGTSPETTSQIPTRVYSKPSVTASSSAPSSAYVESNPVVVWLTAYNSGELAASSASATLTYSTCALNTGSTANVSLGTINGRSSASTSWTLRAPSSTGTCTAYATVSYTYGGTTYTSTSNTNSISILSLAQQPSGGGGGGGGGGAALPETKETKKITHIDAGKGAKVTLDKYRDHGLMSINITVRNSVNNISISVVKLSGSPATVTKNLTGKVYMYMEIDKANITDADISSAKIQFVVNRTWITENDIDKGKVYLNRWETNKWNRLNTSMISENSTDAVYEAESPGLSVFAIEGEAAAVVPPAAQDCRELNCSSGYECKLVGAEYKCIEIGLVEDCISKGCPEGQVCKRAGEENVCVAEQPIEDCRTRSCPSGYACNPVGDGYLCEAVPIVKPPVAPPADYKLAIIAVVLLIVIALLAYFLIVRKPSKPEAKKAEQKKK